MEMVRAVTVFLLFSTVLLGGAYPWLVTLVAHTAFPEAASGSLVSVGGKPVGSRLIGQEFKGLGYVWGRPSATGEGPYNPLASGASNLGANHPALHERVTARALELRKHHPDPKAPIPVDLLTASGSGLDPHISPAAAEYQAPRIAKARKMKEEQVLLLIEAHTQPRFLGLFGEPVVHVLELNLALDELSKAPYPPKKP